MDRVKGGYSSEAARRRFFRDYFDFHRWIRAQPIENLQYLTGHARITQFQQQRFLRLVSRPESPPPPCIHCVNPAIRICPCGLAVCLTCEDTHACQ